MITADLNEVDYRKSSFLYQPLAVADPEVNLLIEEEKDRQFNGLELIASEVTSIFSRSADRIIPLSP